MLPASLYRFRFTVFAIEDDRAKRVLLPDVSLIWEIFLATDVENPKGE
jgi:hypothetical protein